MRGTGGVVSEILFPEITVAITGDYDHLLQTIMRTVAVV